MTIKKIRLLLLLIIVFSFSCSGIINKLDDGVLVDQSIPYKENAEKLFCKSTGDIQLISPQNTEQERFKVFIQKQRFTFIEKLVLWSFLQMNLRPDTSSPSSHFQIVYNKNKYLSVSSSNINSLPVYKALDYLLKEYKNKRGLLELARIYDRDFKGIFKVTKSLAEFLNKNKIAIQKIKSLKPFYLRGDETLRENERLYRQKHFNLVKNFSSKKINYKIVTSLTPYSNKYCNFNLEEYRKSNFSIKQKIIPTSIFGIKDESDIALISLTNRIDNFQSIKNSFFFRGTSINAMTSVCMSTTPNKELILFSSESRDSAQHLMALIDNGIFEYSTKSEIDKSLRQSRFLFLNSPLRLIFESEKTDDITRDNFYKLNIPLYNSKELGLINAYFRNKNSDSFFLDQRKIGGLTCR